MTDLITIEEFLQLKNDIPVVDVRSPGEFEQGHIPGTINIPLFTNDQRAEVGTLFKQKGQKEAVLAGLEIAGRKMRTLAESGIKCAKDNQLLVHCWRGGMRSASMAWLFESCGIHCRVLKGGYKSYRGYIRDFFSIPFNFIVLGGMTGSGKTAILDEFENRSYQVLKLEKIANHKGSAFGNLGEQTQKTNEQFENDVFSALALFDVTKIIFVEDESRGIGRNIIPPELFESMSLSRLVFVEMDKKIRISRLVEDYGKFSNEELNECILKISRKLGGQRAQAAIDFLEKGHTEAAADISLEYYDKTYNFGLSRKKNSEIITIPVVTANAQSNAREIIKVLKNKGII